MKTKLLSMTMALFLGCANAAGVDAGKYVRTKNMTTQDFVKLFKGATPEQMCSKAGNLGEKTLRSFDGKFCNDKTVCTMLKDNCFPGGKDPHGAKTSGCYATCKNTFGAKFFEGSNASSPPKIQLKAVEHIYEQYNLPLSASCEEIKKGHEASLKACEIGRDIGHHSNLPASEKPHEDELEQINGDFEALNAYKGCRK